MTSTHPDFAGVDGATMTDADMLRHFNDNRVEPTRLLNGAFLSVDSERGVCRCRFEIVPAFCHSQGRIAQGGFLTGMIDIAMAHAAIARARFAYAVPTLDLKISFLEAVGPGPVIAEGRVLREWEIFARDHEVEVAPGVRFPAWTYNGRIPGPTLRCVAGDQLRVRFVNASAHPHTMHFHGIHPAEMDGIPDVGAGVIRPGGSATYEFEAQPFGLHLYHCHVGPLAEHIARGLYGTFVVDPPTPRPPADELVMVMHGYNTTFDGQGNQLYAVNGIPFHFMHEPIRVRRGELVRIYLVNVLEYDLVNSFHLHGNFFDYFPTGTRLQPAEYTDTVVQAQGQRGICELRFPYTGRYMFHAHKSEFAELGWMGFFEVTER